MPRPLWKGALSFGLVTVPVSLYPATARSEKLSFHLLHVKDKGRIDYRRVCEKEDVEVPWKDIVKGYEYAKGKYVVLTDEDFEKAQTPATKVFDVRVFVGEREIDFLYFDTPYYVAPAGKQSVKAYALLRDALAETARVGVGTIVLRQREHLAALEPAGDVLVLSTMRFAHEVRAPRDLDVPRRRQGYQAKEMKLAQQLIETLAGPWNPREFRDTYTDVLRKVIQQKIKGREIVAPETPKVTPITSLTKALEASLAGGRRRAGTTRARRPAARRRGGTGTLRRVA